METNHLKFVSLPDAMEEIKTTLLMQSELKKREEIQPLLRQLEDLQIRKDTINISAGFMEQSLSIAENFQNPKDTR
jgi:hypothetical protein